MNGDKDGKKKKKINLKKECNPFTGCKRVLLKPEPGQSRPTPGGGTKKVIQPEYEEKWSYQAGTTIAGEPMQTEPEEQGTYKTQREAKTKAEQYKTRYEKYKR